MKAKLTINDWINSGGFKAEITGEIVDRIKALEERFMRMDHACPPETDEILPCPFCGGVKPSEHERI